MKGNVLRQLIQPKVQNSISTTRPRSSLSLSGAELIQSPVANSGALADSELLYSVELPNELRISFVKPVAQLKAATIRTPATIPINMFLRLSIGSYIRRHALRL